MSYTPPPGALRLETVDAHAAGEPLRVVVSGWPAMPGGTILAKRRYARENLDHLRRVLMLEPRGHADMYGCVTTEPVTPDGDLGVLFLHNDLTPCWRAEVACSSMRSIRPYHAAPTWEAATMTPERMAALVIT